jgi:peptidyl-prolyl cis-trans isomerase SurA
MLHRGPRRLASLSASLLRGTSEKNPDGPRFVRVGRATLVRSSLVALAFGVVVAAAPRPAHAVVVEKVVAVVGDEAILLSELHKRAEPFLRQILQHVPEGPQRAAAESQMYKDLLNKLVEEELEQQSAEHTKTVVSADDLDKALQSIADQQGMTLSQLFEATEKKTGLSETEYRAEIRRQVLEGKLLNQRVRGRIRIGEEELKSTYQHALREERERREYHPAWIALRVQPGSSDAEKAERLALAKQIVEEARSGSDFAELARKYSDDPTKVKGGDLGIRAPQKSAAAQTGKREFLSDEFEKYIMPLEPGEITDPIQAGDGIVIIKLITRQKSRYTSFEDARDEMVQRLQNELLQKERDELIEELKRRTHIDLRL